LTSVLKAEVTIVGSMLETEMHQGNIKLGRIGETEESPDEVGNHVPITFNLVWHL